jgi:hypothetical protein
LFARNVGSFTCINHLHATQHLTHDDFDVLVINLNALQTINVLHFVDDVTRQCFDTQQSQNVLWISRTVNNHLTLINYLAVMH